MSVGWLKVRRTDYETFEKQTIMPHALSIILGYLVCCSWHAYFKRKDHYITGRPHGTTILDRIMKNETANQPTLPPPNHGWQCANAKMHHFPILVWRGGGINIPSISKKHRRQPGEKLNINHSRLRDEISAQAAPCHGHLWRQNHDDKLVRVSGIFSRPGSVTSSVLTKL